MNNLGIVKGFKVFNPDWTCNPNGKPFQYAVGGIYEEDVKPLVRSRGFHFCEKAADCFNCYQFKPENKVAEVIALGEVDSDGTKSCTNKIQIVREIPWQEVLEIVNMGKGCTGIYNSGDWNSGNRNGGDWNSGNYNSGNRNSGNRNSGNYNSGNRNSGNYNTGDCNTGDRNTGDWNTGNCNTGDWNTGNCNTGDCNTGDRNTGDWNTGNWNTGDCNTGNCNTGDWNTGDFNKTRFSNGCFNTVEPKIYLFNKPSKWTYHDWVNSEASYLLNQISSDALKYIWLNDMTDEEKAAHPEAKITGGYLKKMGNSECAIIWWCKLSDQQKAVITAIPNFDKEIFKEIIGIDVDRNYELGK